MTAAQIAVLAYNSIPLVGGAYGTLLGFRVIGGKPGHSKWDDWHRRWGGLMKVAGPLLILIGLFTLAQTLFFSSPPAAGPTPPAAWVRAYIDDRQFSAEFPATPTAVIKAPGGVEMHNLRLDHQERDCHYFLGWYMVPDEPGVTVEERLDTFRDNLPSEMRSRGENCKLIREERLAGPGVGRLLVFQFGTSALQRYKVHFLNGHVYRAIATTPKDNPAADADGVRFVESMRWEADVNKP